MKRSFASTRFGRAVALASGMTLLMAGIAFADNISVDGDTLKAGNNLNYTLSSQGNSNLCTTRGTAVTGQASINRTGGGGQLEAGETVSVALSTTNAGITFSSPNTGTVPTPWSGGANFSINYTTTVSAAVPDGSYVVTVTATGGTSGALLTDTFTVSVACTAAPTNDAPVITAVDFEASSVGCRVSVDLDVTFTDPDSTSWSAEIDWDYDGTTFTTDTSVASVTSPFSESHTYNAPGNYTAAVRVTDDDGAVSDIETASITVTQTYSVAFLNPLNASSVGDLVANTFKNGRVLPVKATIFDDCALATVDGTSSVTPTVKLDKSALPGGTEFDAIEEFADAGQSSGNTNQMRWSTDGFWIYNLDSKALKLTSGQNYRLNIMLGSTQATAAQWVILSPQR